MIIGGKVQSIDWGFVVKQMRKPYNMFNLETTETILKEDSPYFFRFHGISLGMVIVTENKYKWEVWDYELKKTMIITLPPLLEPKYHVLWGWIEIMNMKTQPRGIWEKAHTRAKDIIKI
jgi:hypothetical protein